MVNSAGTDGGLILGVDASNIRAVDDVIHLSRLLAAAEPLESGFEKVMVCNEKWERCRHNLAVARISRDEFVD